MGFSEQISSFLTRLATLDLQFKTIQSSADRQQNAIDGLSQKLDELTRHMAETDVRIARLEESRNAERREMEALISRFQLEVERAELRMRALPPTEKS